jgi:predicted enzyme related to lactoylglutathione lyase
MNTNPVVHFEMPYDDRDRMVDFYAKAFGWTSNKLGPEMGDYVVTMTSETDETTKRPKHPGMIDGGFFRRTAPDQHPSVVIAVEDIRAAMKNVEAAGGKVLGGRNPGEPDEIPGVGLYVAILDSEGNRVGLLQPSQM